MKNLKNNLIAYIFGPFLFAHNSKNNVDSINTIYDQEHIDLVIRGPRGLSPELKVKKLECSICHKDYEECEHIEGEKYQDQICECFIADFEFLKLVHVSHPQDPRARITDMLIIKKENSKNIYTWHGFEVDHDNRRFSHIQQAKDNHLLTECVALHFSTFFCMNQKGVIKYPVETQGSESLDL